MYAINWLNVGAIYSLMEPDLKGGVSGLGTLTSSFFLGIGLLQVPGGILAAKWGPKKVVALGIMISSTSAAGVSLTTGIAEAAVLRFLVGVGMAFVFSPSIVIVASYLGHHRSGANVGLFNSAYSVGGIFGLFGWTVIASLTGWRASIALSGAIGVISGILVIFLVPDEHDFSFKVDKSKLYSIFKDKRLILTWSGYAQSYDWKQPDFRVHDLLSTYKSGSSYTGCAFRRSAVSLDADLLCPNWWSGI